MTMPLLELGWHEDRRSPCDLIVLKEASMFAALFEVRPKTTQWDAYLGTAKMLRPELENIDGFVDNIRYQSLTRDGWILSLSSWRDEKALVRWRTKMRHHQAQQKGRAEILADYHLRVGQVTRDMHVPAGQVIQEQSLDETEVGDATTAILLDGKRPSNWITQAAAHEVAEWLGVDRKGDGLVFWDVFDAVLTPGDVIAMMAWRTNRAAQAFEGLLVLKDGVRLRRVRVVRDYGMFDRREATQYYPDILRTSDTS